MATYLVTGGAGFIGSNIVRRLLQQKQSVVVLDNLSTGKLKNISDVRDKILFVEGDIRDPRALTQVCHNVDYVLHQAALGAVAQSIEDPREAHEVNITGTLQLLLAAREAKVKRVVFASSSSVYGSAAAARNVETLPPSPESPYALTKLTGEYYCRLFASLYGLETVSLRYFNVFGPYQNPASRYSAVIPILVSHLLRRHEPEIHGDGEQSRDFTYIDNVVQANLKAATAKGIDLGGTYNIASGTSISINELYQELQNILNVTVPARFVAHRVGDIRRSQADIRRAEHGLGYVPEVSFAEGLKRAVAWYQKNL